MTYSPRQTTPADDPPDHDEDCPACPQMCEECQGDGYKMKSEAYHPLAGAPGGQESYAWVPVDCDPCMGTGEINGTEQCTCHRADWREDL